MNTIIESMKTKCEEFFKDAFCASSAELLVNLEEFEIVGVVKITRGDHIFYIANVEPKQTEEEIV